MLTAKTLGSYESGAVVTWNVKINALASGQAGSPMRIGLTTLGVDTSSEWGSDECNNAAYYLTSQGNMFNGGMLVAESFKGQFREGDTVTVRLDDEGVYFALNGVDLEACIKPITGSLRLSGVPLLARWFALTRGFSDPGDVQYACRTPATVSLFWRRL